MFIPRNRKFSFGLAIVSIAIMVCGCSSRQAVQAPLPVEVKVMQVIKQDTPVTYEFVGEVIAKNEVQIRAKVSGNIVTKMVTGGASVSAGQPLFQIDRRQYEAALLSTQSQLAQSEAVLSNCHLDTLRYQKLAAQQAVAAQVLDTALSTERQNVALVNTNRARVQQAEADLQDTLIVAPFSGRIDINDLSAGSFVQAGQTVLATISSLDPVFVQFSMSENEYLRFAQNGRGASPDKWVDNLRLILSDGTQYPLTGRVEQVDRGLAQDTATLTMKASFSNPQGVLLPGMFARVMVQAEMRPGALLIPQRAIQQLLGKTFVTIVGEDNKAETRAIKIGPRIGNLCIIEDGVTTTDHIVVEGFMKASPGTLLKVTMIDPNELPNSSPN